MSPEDAPVNSNTSRDGTSANSFTRSQAGIHSSINVLLDVRLRGHDTGPG